MNRSSVRWIALAVVGAMIAVVAVGLLGGGEGDGDEPGADPGDAAPAARATEVLDGPHAFVELCTGVACPAVDEAAQDALLAELEGDDRVASAELISSEQAYAMFLDQFGDQEELVDSIDPEQVPARILLDLHDPASIAELADAYQGHEGVARVMDARTVDP
jgi:hypothetical protein